MRSRPALGAANFEFTEGDFGIWVNETLVTTMLEILLGDIAFGSLPPAVPSFGYLETAPAEKRFEY